LIRAAAEAGLPTEMAAMAEYTVAAEAREELLTVVTAEILAAAGEVSQVDPAAMAGSAEALEEDISAAQVDSAEVAAAISSSTAIPARSVALAPGQTT
jgi:hypothetical protein